MAEASGKNVYERDFYAWAEEQAKAVEERRWADVDRENVAEELRSLGGEVKEEIRDRVAILIAYLLKWRHLAEFRGLAWKENIDRQREALQKLLKGNATLTPYAREFVPLAYDDARQRLKYDTYFFSEDFPPSCPFTIDDVFDPEFYPEELDAPAVGAFPTARSLA
jgi:hypothetical protein